MTDSLQTWAVASPGATTPTLSTPAPAPEAVTPTAASIASEAFTDRRNPPAYRDLSPSESALFDLGLAVLNTQWVPAGTAGAARRDGVGPLFNAASCDACHNDGAHGRGPSGDGPAPAALVIQLESPSATPTLDPPGDPIYGHVFNTDALDGVAAEGTVNIHYQEKAGRYPDGTSWSLRVPSYELADLHYGPLARRTVIKPRLAPQLFGVGLLDAVPRGAISERPSHGHRQPAVGRFGWQAAAASVRDQTTRAFAREMGLTSSDRPADDCTVSEPDCLQQPNGGAPEVAEDLLNAVTGFQRCLAVPASPVADRNTSAAQDLPARIGCTSCHQPKLPVLIQQADGSSYPGTIAPYTDLRLHDLGAGLSDRDVAGRVIESRWRTAPLWGIGYRIATEHDPTFLHDGRARSAAEAILWHDGEARGARQKFEALSAAQRRAVLDWLRSL